MLSANDARELMLESSLSYEINDIMQMIEEKVKSGSFSLTLDCKVSEDIKYKLIELRYAVSNKYPEDNTIYRI